ncbi:MAG TPA: CAP domain-containing protein [Oribacterium sp.]|nr:CAP domain-containing protein [Oribacterium sp.]HCS67489.1 CAP domain-containing protein [Oribacterium sp.]
MKNLFRTLIVSVFLGVLMSTAAFAQNSTEAAVITKVNEIRVANGLNALRYDAELEADSSVRANEITTKFSHTRPDGSDWYTVDEDLMYGENLAEGYNSADAVVNAWMASPEHKANILKSDFTSIAVSSTTKNGKTYWAQEFGMD